VDSSRNGALDDVVVDGLQGSVTEGRWRLRVPAADRTPRRVRGELRQWLAALGWPEEQAQDAVLAVDEAVSNAVEHAYASEASSENGGVGSSGEDENDSVAAGDAVTSADVLSGDGGVRVEDLINVEVLAEVEVTAEVVVLDGRTRQLRFCVRGWGRWRPKPVNPGARGRGLDLMVGLMAKVVFHPGEPVASDAAVGTEVTLVSHSVRAPAR
jgi:hypothetical protein